MIFTTFLPLYIDPGTGSMLFSILIGAAATVFFLFRALILKIKFFFSGKKDGSAQVDSSYKPYVIYNEGNQYWNTFKPVVEEFEARKIPLEYLTSSKNDPIFEQKYNYVKAEFIGEGNSAFAKLNMLSAGIVLMTTPGLQVYQLKRSKNVKHYSHVLHMPNDATTYRLFGLDFFDSVLLTGDYQATDLRYLEEKRGINLILTFINRISQIFQKKKIIRLQFLFRQAGAMLGSLKNMEKNFLIRFLKLDGELLCALTRSQKNLRQKCSNTLRSATKTTKISFGIMSGRIFSLLKNLTL